MPGCLQPESVVVNVDGVRTHTRLSAAEQSSETTASLSLCCTPNGRVLMLGRLQPAASSIVTTAD